MLVAVLLIMQHPRVWAQETPAQRTRSLALIGVVIALSSSLANLTQFQLGKVIADPVAGLLAGGAANGILVAIIAGVVDATRKRIQVLRDRRMPVPPSEAPLSVSASAIPPHIEKLAEWLALQEKPAILASLQNYERDLVTPEIIALLILLRRTEQGATWRQELRWCRDLLIKTRQLGIAAGWQVLSPPP